MENIQLENNSTLAELNPQKKGLLSNLSKKQKLSLLTLSFFVAIIPLGTSAALLTTRLNSRAYLPATPSTPPVTITPTASPSATPIICNNPVKTFSAQRPCRSSATRDQDQNNKDKNKTTYQYANITCQNGYKELYKSQSCLNETQLKSIAVQICQRKATCPPPSITNRSPIIQTTSLPAAFVGRGYSTSIIVIDQDQKDSVTVTSSPLPGNLKLLCKKTSTANKVECLLSGTPQKIGIFDVEIKATDDKGAVTTKTLKLTVQNRPQPKRD